MLYFASLRPGSHVLQVKAELPGQVITEVTELSIEVLPPFWLSTPAFVLYLLLLLLAAALIYFAVRQWKRREMAIKQLKDKVLEWSQKVQARVGRGIEISPSEVTVSSLDEELISNVIRHVEEHMADADYSVAQLGSDVGMTRGHLYKKLMAITGKSPIEFVRIIKMKRGKSLLDQGKTNISEVADMVGYSPKQFAHYFKMMYGNTPTEYLRKLKQ
jgi:AraC-like DNA-binding protein